jgi:nucleoside-diphosphate-sugar epimerase/predicted dehydrogenase
MPALRQLGWRPSVLVDPSLEQVDLSMGKFRDRIRQPKKSADWQSAEDDFDAAIIALPAPLHGSIASSLLAAGKHVLLEKPLLPKSKQLSMSEAAATNNVVFSTSMPRRYLAISRWTKALLESGMLGEIENVVVREGMAAAFDIRTGLQLPPELPYSGGMWSIGADTLDLMLWWFGDVELLNYCDDNEGGGVEVERLLDCRLSSGAGIKMEFSRTRRLPNSVKIEGANGFVEVHLFKNHVISGSPNTLSFKYEGFIPGGMQPQFVVELFKAEIGEFKKSVVAGKRTTHDQPQYTSVAELIERCYAVRRPIIYPWAKPARETTTGVAITNPVLPRGSKVLVTGATGFIGGRLVERLLKEQGARIRCTIRVGRSDTRLSRFPVEMEYVDFRQVDHINRVVDGVDYVFHCAHDSLSARQNIEGLRNLIAACAAHPVKGFVFVSTFAVYEPFPDGLLTEETGDGDRSNEYVDVKLNSEKMVLDAVRNEGLAATIVQPSIVYGPFSGPWTNFPAEMLLSGGFVLPDHGEGLCNAVYIDDLIDGIILAAATREAQGERFILSGPEVVTWATFFTSVARILGTNPPVFWPSERINQNQDAVTPGLQLTTLSPRTLVGNLVRRPSVRLALEACLDRLPLQLRKSVVNKMERTSPRSHHAYIPDRRALAFYSSKPIATSEKARSKLGYRPVVDFQSGMTLTAPYLQWAYLGSRYMDCSVGQ